MRLIDADALIDDIKHGLWDWDSVDGIMSSAVLKQTITDIKNMPTIEAEPVIKCKDCRWFDKTEDSSYGYCHAMKHGYYSEHWEISIYRRYKEDFYCADGEKMNAEEEPYEADL